MMKLWVVLGMAGVGMMGVLGCTEAVKAEVSCETTKDGVDCDVKESMGKGEAKVCWDFTVECANGTKVTAPNTCATVKDGGSEKASIPNDKLTDVAKCDKATKATVSNLTINGKEAK